MQCWVEDTGQMQGLHPAVFTAQAANRQEAGPNVGKRTGQKREGALHCDPHESLQRNHPPDDSQNNRDDLSEPVDDI